MRFLTGQRLLAMTAVLTLAACADGDTTVDSSNLPAPARLNASSAASVPSVRISEIHYDNTGTDAGEFVEVSAPAGTDLSGWSIVLYNGSGGASYDTDALSGIVANQCSGRGTVVINYPSNGIQNGSPDGIALVNGTTVVEFLSYEGSFAATNGPANGMTSTDIGVSENGSEPVGQSLSRTGANVWSSGTASNGSCNPGEN
ncbi:MAG TPA: hypothetical protein VFN90_00230, partial [Gemmatimonadales bacterium]|nr:hypothetical protein [Gemmatimonadales bacterium]